MCDSIKDAWERRGLDYVPGPFLNCECDSMIAWIQRCAPEEILEVGAGWGRIYSLLAPLGLADKFTMCDFVNSMRRGCWRQTGLLPDLWDGVTLPYEDNSFDMVLSYAVLQHVSHETIEAVFAEHVRVARRYLFVSSWIAEGSMKSGGWMFKHNYRALFRQCGISITTLREWKHKSSVKQHWMVKKNV